MPPAFRPNGCKSISHELVGTKAGADGAAIITERRKPRRGRRVLDREVGCSQVVELTAHHGCFARCSRRSGRTDLGRANSKTDGKILPDIDRAAAGYSQDSV